MDVLTKKFFQRPVLDVAPDLIGAMLMRRLPSGEMFQSRITEVEAYDGEQDLVCHASRGRTERTKIMYQSGGMWYIYIVYGMHHMLNIVTGPQGYPAAVLIRATADISGPGRLTHILGVDRTHNGMRVRPSSGIWIVAPKAGYAPRISRTPRIGVHYAGTWAQKPYRFVQSP